MHPFTVKRWRELGLLTAEQSTDAPSYLFHPDQPRPDLTQVWAAESADRHGTPSRHTRLRAAGLLTQDEAAAEHDVAPSTIHHWRELGLLTAERSDLKDRWLYHPPPADPHPTPGPRRRSRRQPGDRQSLTRPRPAPTASAENPR